MKQNSTLVKGKLLIFTLSLLFVLAFGRNASAQITLVLGDPTKFIYGLTSNGEIYEIKTNNGNTQQVIKNNTYSGNSPSSANGLAYNSINGKFYYFKRNVSASPQEFVSFDPKLNIVTILATSTCSADVHTGSISQDGKGYYTTDILGNLNYYNIAANTWKKITSTIVDNFGANVTSVMQAQSAGDIAIDGYGNMFVLTSSNSNYGLYKIPAPLPTNSVASLTVKRIIAPTSSTPTGNSFAGIAFNSNGQIFMGTRGDDKLYVLQNVSTLTFVANLQNSDAANDLTSLNFPLVSVLPVKWVSFSASLQNNSNVSLDWNVIELQNQGFYVQHSVDGNKWENITFIKSRNIAETIENYSYSYSPGLSGKQYYRINQVDIDGKESYSDVKIINFTSANSEMSVWPNPARNVINIENDGVKTSIVAKAQVYNLSGKLSIEKALQQGINSIDISSLPAGAYIVKTNTNTGDMFTQKIIKQ